MSLKDRILNQGLTVATVAERANTKIPHLYNLLNRVRRPRVDLAKRIDAATGGIIRWTEFFEDLPIQLPLPEEDPASKKAS